MALSFVFANIDISALSGIELLVRDVNVYPDRNLSTYKLARSDKSITTNAEFTSKTIRLSGNLKGDDGSRQDAEDKWAVVKGYLNQREQKLVITQFGKDIEYTATTARINDEWIGGYLEWSIEFLCADPVGYEQNNSTFLDVFTLTAATTDETVTVGGSHYAEPIIYITLNSGTGLTGQSIIVKNGETGQSITITRNWAAGDNLRIDNLNKTVTVNGSFVDYTGTFLKFYPGTRTFSYVDTFTTRSVSISGEYVKRYV